jgi:hypothetical protein
MKKGKLAQCFTTHAVLHYIVGVGLGLLLVGLLPTLAVNALLTGLVIVVVGVVLEMVMVK